MEFKEVARAYSFGNLTLDLREGQLFQRTGEPVPLTPKAFETLVALVENNGHVLSKDELMKKVWPDSFVEENNLSQNISQLRRALQAAGGDDAAIFIETVPRRGYRFRAQVTVLEQESSETLVLRERTRTRVLIEEDDDAETEAAAGRVTQAAALVGGGRRVSDAKVAGVPPAADEFPPELMLVPETKYAKSGDVNIAYQVLGNGPLDLVFVMGWISHLEYFWRHPTFARFLRRLATFSRLILFDKRGTGLSDRVPVHELPTLEQRMDDVRAVMEAVGSDRAALCGVSEGGVMSALFAATYPERTAALVMFGTYAKRIWAPDYPWAPTVEQRNHFFEEIQTSWGGPVGIEERAPSMRDDPEFRQWWATYLRMGASPGAAVALTKMNAEVDVRHVLPTISVPTLVLHRAGDLCLKVEEGRYVAERIPGAKYVELPGEDHLPFVGDQDVVLDEIEEFLTGVRHTAEPERVLATVLFARIVDTPRQVAARGEREWRSLVERFRAHISKEIAWFRGREIDMTGVGPLATFDGPARAIRCACAISEYASRLGIEIRAGLHTGECDLLDESRVGGVAVEVGREIRDRALAGEVLVSHTVKDLVAGSGLDFDPRGGEVFDKIPGEWQLYKVERGARA
ncbi:MAG TPA: alpha/beta fold hydrolase [Pyrinomonadaceae bacterium]|jgi:pimeloyl-ACP methyl ester carboxylesterase/DNA-binding winged helix-turn-helix (wHTH) protein